MSRVISPSRSYVDTVCTGVPLAVCQLLERYVDNQIFTHALEVVSRYRDPQLQVHG